MHHNDPSSQEHPDIITTHLRMEVHQGHFVGLLPRSIVPFVQLIPMGLISKHHSDKWHLIVDLPSPQGHNINDGISPAQCSLHYTSIDNAVNIIMALEWSTKMVKLDLSNAYCIVPVHPVTSHCLPSSGMATRLWIMPYHLA